MKAKFKKGSPAAKKYMAELRAARKSNSSEKKHTTKRKKTMPKRAKTRVVYRTKKRATRRKKSMFSGAVGQVVGAGAYAVIGEPVVDMIAGKIGMGIPADFLKLLGGLYLSKRTGVIGGAAKSMVIVSAYGLSKQLIGGGFNLGGLFGATTPAVATNGNVNMIG